MKFGENLQNLRKTKKCHKKNWQKKVEVSRYN